MNDISEFFNSINLKSAPVTKVDVSACAGYPQLVIETDNSFFILTMTPQEAMYVENNLLDIVDKMIIDMHFEFKSPSEIMMHIRTENDCTHVQLLITDFIGVAGYDRTVPYRMLSMNIHPLVN